MIYTHIITYIYIHISSCTFVYTCHACMHHVHSYTHIMTYICINISSCTFIYTYHHVHLYTHIITFVYTHITLYIYIHISSCTFIYPCHYVRLYHVYFAELGISGTHFEDFEEFFRYLRKISEVYYTNVRCIGCLMLQVSFRKRATNYRALVQ